MLSPAVPPSSTQPQMTLPFKMFLCAEAPQPGECGTGVHHAMGTVHVLCGLSFHALAS